MKSTLSRLLTLLAVCTSLAWLPACTNTNASKPDATMTTTDAPAAIGSVYDFTVKDIDGKDVSLSAYKGKVLVFVNVASKCGLTPQYNEIQAFYDKYKDKGVVVLGFPANNFAGQEPGSNTDIKTFCTSNYGVTFPMFSKVSVKGGDQAPLYTYLTHKDKNGVEDAAVTWNFQKFLVNRNGQLVKSFSPQTTVENEKFLEAVQGQL
jgi:glutathione peroxidase